MAVTIREYQEQAITNTQSGWAGGKLNQLAVLATGAGKTIILLELVKREYDLAKAAGRPFRALIVAHRTELIDQPIERIAAFWPELASEVGAVMAERNDVTKPITVGSVQTLQSAKRIAGLLAHGTITHLVIDECHHAVANGYLNLVAQLRQANPELLHLGVTATPNRTDADGLGKVYDECQTKVTIKDLIRTGFLVPIRGLAVQTGISLKGVGTVAGDFNQKQLANVYDTSNCFELVVKTHLDKAAGRKGIAFTTSVAGAYALAEEFRAQGVNAAAADGTTAREVRSQLLADFRAGKIDVLVNCFLWTEGLDLPEISVIHWVRPTKSDLVYVQGIGRGLRPADGTDKTDCLILDYIPEDYRDIVMAGDVLGKPRVQRKAEAKAKKVGLLIEGFTTDVDGNGIDGDPDEILLRQLDYLSMSPFAWYLDDGWASLGLGKGKDDQIERTLVITPKKQSDGLHRLLMVARAPGQPEEMQLIGKAADFDNLAERGQEVAERRGAAVLTRNDKEWRKRPATPKQIDLIRKMTQKDASGLKAGEAARIITHAFARFAIRRIQDRLAKAGR
jgi:ATP-dependent helicase IRC3